MRVLLLAILVLSIIIPIGASDAFGEITVATVTFEDELQIASGSAKTPRHVEFNPGGTKMFVVEGDTDFLYEWTLTTGFDLTTATYAGHSERFDLHKNNNNAKGDGQPRGIHFNTDGTKMFVVGNNLDEVNEYSLSTGFDISSGGNSNSAFTAKKDITSSVGNGPQGLEFYLVGGKKHYFLFP